MKLAERAVVSRTRILGRVLALFAPLVLCFIAACSYRLATDRHFSRVHVRLVSIAQQGGVSTGERDPRYDIFICSRFGTAARLEPVTGHAHYWRHAGAVVPVKSVLICASAPISLRADQVQVRCGEHWSRPNWTYSGSELSVVVPDEQIRRGLEKNGFPHALEVKLRNPPQHLLSHTRGMLNWQGDLSLQLLCLLQAAVVVFTGLQILRCAFRAVEFGDAITPDDNAAVFGMASCLQVFLMLLLICQLVFFFGVSAGQRSAVEAAAGLICGLLFATAGTWVMRKLLGVASSRQLIFLGVLLVLLTSIGTWNFRENLQCRPGVAALQCLQAGELLAARGWNGLPELSQPVSSDAVRQALVFSLPAVWLLGPGVASVQAAGLFLQTCCGLLFFLLASRMVGVRGAAGGLILLVLVEPEFRFLGTAASPRIVECFCMLLVFGCFELGRIWLGRITASGRDFPTLTWLAGCLVFGGVLTLLELCSSRGWLALAALLPAVVLLAVMPDVGAKTGGTWGRAAVPAAAVPAGLVLAAGFSWMISEGVDRQIQNYLPASLMITTDADAVLTGVESGTEGSGRSVSVWRDDYFPLIPKSDREEFVGRKLLQEKVAAGSALFGTMLRKAMIYARSDGSFDADPNQVVLPYPVFRAVLNYGLSSWVVLLVLMRLWNPERRGCSRAEAFPICFVVSVLAKMLLMSEAKPEDSLIWLLPMCWSAGAVLWSRPLSGGTQSWFTGLPYQILPGGVLLSAVILLHAALGMVVDRSGRTFARLARVQTDGAAPLIESATDITRVSFTVRFPGRLRTLKAGDRVSDEVRVLCERSDMPSLKFFLSAAHRQSRITKLDWVTVPVNYRIYIDDLLWKSGPISELERPQFCSVDSSFWTSPGGAAGNAVFVKLELVCTADTRLDTAAVRPAVSIEYPWPGASAQ
jgi:hypothetical protein